MQDNYVLKDNIEITKSISWNKSLYKKEQNFTNNNLEKTMIEKILQNEQIKIKWWHRNIALKGFCINGFLNHYPDFIIYTEKQNLILLETKGNHLEGNKDTQLKLELSEIWKNQSNKFNAKLNNSHINEYYYLMVFENPPATNSQVAKSMDKAIKLLENL